MNRTLFGGRFLEEADCVYFLLTSTLRDDVALKNNVVHAIFRQTEVSMLSRPFLNAFANDFACFGDQLGCALLEVPRRGTQGLQLLFVNYCFLFEWGGFTNDNVRHE